MSAKKTKESKAEKNFENIGEALTTTEQFLEKNQKSILTGLLVVIVIVGAFLAYHYLYKLPRNNEAQAAIYKGERYFQEGEDSLALFGNGNDYIGFESVIDQYKGTKTADLAHAYAGISYNRLGNYEKALEHLKKFYWVEEDVWISLNISAAGLRTINKIGLDAAIKKAAEKGYLNA
jgi:tetratricopeptide (TPR) repeat protein